VVGGRPGELKLKKIHPKQLPRIQSKLNVITSPIAQEIRRSYTAGEYSAEQAMVQMIAVRVTTARKLMHEKPEGRSHRQRGPHRSREQVRILMEVGTLKAALVSMGKPGQASAAATQCLAEFGIYHDLQMTPQEAHHINLCPQWKIVLNAMIESRRNELQPKAIKQDRWNNREADRQAEKAFLEEHKDLANSLVSTGRSQHRRNWFGECPGAAGSKSLQRHYPMLRTVSVATQQEHWEP